ncbi:MAG: NAD(P)-binding domain-containing protein, partial [Clostridia bacterium]|nr:NAD(P)-binding domain-containing protein [Clostridia bacterium]
MGIETLKIGFIGAGNMGGALAKAAAKSECPTEIMLADKDEAKAKKLAEYIDARSTNNAV